jgi:hypothetical protein
MNYPKMPLVSYKHYLQLFLSCLTVSYLCHLFGVAFCTPCPTRWNSTYDNLDSFLSNYKGFDIADQLFTKLGLQSLTKGDIVPLNEKML